MMNFQSGTNNVKTVTFQFLENPQNVTMLRMLMTSEVKTVSYLPGDFILYSRKYWQELNLAIGPKSAIAKILAGLRFGTGSPHVYTCMQVRNFNLAVAKADSQTAKFNSLPSFPAIQYSSLNF